MILITGATGLVGATLVHEFQAHKERIRILTRDSKNAERFKDDPYVEVVVGDMQKPDALSDVLLGVDKAVLISSADPLAMAETQIAFIDAAQKAGVKHLIKLSCLHPDKNSPALFLRMHAEIEKRLKNSSIDWTLIRPAHFMQMYLMNAQTISEQNAIFMPMGSAHVAPIALEDLAKVFYKVLTTEGHERKIYELSGPESLTLDDIAKQFSRVLGRTINYVNITPEQLGEQLTAFGMPAQLIEAINELYGERRQDSEAEVLLGTHRAFGIKPTTFSEFVIRNKAVFGGASM